MRRLERPIEKLAIASAADMECPSGTEYRCAGEIRRRRFQESTARAGERAHGCVAVDLGEKSRGAPGRMIAGLRFTFDNNDGAVGNEMRSDGSARDPTTYDGDVVIHRTIPMLQLHKDDTPVSLRSTKFHMRK